ncbi:hypothetical protein CEXT_485511 [Caerostris extrusa]|uniref:Uncharacterized protein n=1 Tax=Caerostris extrusa TaxID=172846 RepID=A0AAV4VHW1_CAEEX|nr:hypothetical protein CEXT_485511 [Caerostris extrusa]
MDKDYLPSSKKIDKSQQVRFAVFDLQKEVIRGRFDVSLPSTRPASNLNRETHKTQSNLLVMQNYRSQSPPKSTPSFCKMTVAKRLTMAG